MARNVLIHVVGRVDIGAEKDSEIEERLTKIEESPEEYIDLVVQKEREHGVDLPPIVQTLRLAEANQCWPDEIIFLGTEQSPGGDGDTFRIAVVLKDVLPVLGGLFASPIPHDVRAVKVAHMSAEAFSNAARKNVDPEEGRSYFLSIAGGGKSSFNGALAGLLSKGIIPYLLEANTSEDRGPIDMHRLVDSMSDIRRYLTRKRMWWPLAENLGDQQDNQKYLRELHFGERRHVGKQRNRSSSLELGISSLLADLAVEDQGWGRKMTRLVEMRSREIVESSQRTDDDFPTEEIANAYKRARNGEGGEKVDTADQINWMAKEDHAEWRRLEVVPNQISEFWRTTDRRIGARNVCRIARNFRHRIILDENYRGFHAQVFPHLFELLTEGQNEKFELDRFALKVSEFGYGIPWTVATPVTQVIRAIGAREDREIQDAISDFVNADPSGIRDVFLFESMTSDLNDIEALSRRLLLELQDRESELFKQRKSQISAVELILGQGTKAMNLAMIIAGAVHAFHLGVPLKLYEAPKPPNSKTEVKKIAILSSQQLKQQLLPDTAVMSAISASLSVVDLKQAALLGDLLSEKNQDLAKEISSLRMKVDFPFEDIDEKSAQSCFNRGMPAVAFLISQREINGDCDAVSRVSPLLTAMTDSKKINGTKIDDMWKTDPILKPLWRQRNNALHHNVDPKGDERFAVWPSDLSEQIVFDRFVELLKIDSAEVRNRVRDEIKYLKARFENIRDKCAAFDS
jgi:hypothetical protein